MSTVYKISRVLKMLSSPPRLAVILSLADGAKSVPVLSQDLAISCGQLQVHVQELVRAGLVLRGSARAGRARQVQLAAIVNVLEDKLQIDIAGYPITIGRQIEESVA